ncbi:hypothetical protein ACFPRL_21220 [Pseudoclavibacter helvolus]
MGRVPFGSCCQVVSAEPAQRMRVAGSRAAVHCLRALARESRARPRSAYIWTSTLRASRASIAA